MPSDTHDQYLHDLQPLLKTFTATSQGEGDVNAGTNLLVARAVTLANLARPGSGIQMPDGVQMKVGCSLLVSGGLVSGLVLDGVLAEAGRQQNILIAHLRREAENALIGAREKGRQQNPPSTAFQDLSLMDGLLFNNPARRFAVSLQSPPRPLIRDLVARPKTIVTTKGPRDLEKQLSCIHECQPVVALTLFDDAEASAYAPTCRSLLDGLYPVESTGETAKAQLLVNDPTGVASRVDSGTGGKAAWLGHMVWLVDSSEGPDAAEATCSEGKLYHSDTSGRFHQALNLAFSHRFVTIKPEPLIRDFDLKTVQFRWAAFLRDMEGRLPGISGTARNLLATLAFGLTELANAPNHNKLTFTPEGVAALGRWAIHRMANARAAMRDSTRQERLQNLAIKIIGMLEDAPVACRDIYRSLGIPANDCKEALHALEADGLARQAGNGWKRIGRRSIERKFKEAPIDV
ncbi:MAG: hypothetical protein H7A51_19300 [Akkermansiaceae bacterium]|nr:hypothetical protein [Akkermansiaceae bacterium]